MKVEVNTDFRSRGPQSALYTVIYFITRKFKPPYWKKIIVVFEYNEPYESMRQIHKTRFLKFKFNLITSSLVERVGSNDVSILFYLLGAIGSPFLTLVLFLRKIRRNIVEVDYIAENCLSARVKYDSGRLTVHRQTH